MFERWVEKGLLECWKRKHRLIAFSPSPRDCYRPLPERHSGRIQSFKAHGFLKKHDITPEKLVKIQRLDEIAVKRGQSLPRWRLPGCWRTSGWPLSWPAPAPCNSWNPTLRHSISLNQHFWAAGDRGVLESEEGTRSLAVMQPAGRQAGHTVMRSCSHSVMQSCGLTACNLQPKKLNR